MIDEIPQQPTIEQKVLEKEYVKGYQRKPESPLVGKLGKKMAERFGERSPGMSHRETRPACASR